MCAITTSTKDCTSATAAVLPKLGFLGIGWIGRHRMQALLDRTLATGVAIHDTHQPHVQQAMHVALGARPVKGLEQLLAEDIDGVVIATPSGMHARQAIASLQAGKAVFCQKPLGRSLAESREVVAAAKAADRLLAVDYCYRHVRALGALKQLVDENALGTIYAVEAIFHNAYGPDKPWYYDPQQSGGGCLMDLGSHLADALLWLFDQPTLEVFGTTILSAGQPVIDRHEQVEDYAEAHLKADTGLNIRLACSWKLPLGKDAEIRVNVFGTEGGASCYNVNGSFYDFQCDRYHHTQRETLISPPDNWGGRAIQAWATKLAAGSGYDSSADDFLHSAALLERIYNHHGS